MAHRSGFVNIIGNPNVGKSTLMNQLVGEKLSIITSKAQTTRHRIMGIVNGDDFQIVYSDTPGILKPNYKLQEKMMKFVRGAITDADVLLYVTDTVEDSDRSAEIIEKVRLSQIPTIVVINKVDLTTPDKLTALVEKWQALLPDAIIAPCSAKENFNVEGVFNLILERLPEGEAFYPKDTLTDKTLRFFASEPLRFEIVFCEQRRIEELRNVDLQPLAHLMDDAQLHRIIGTVDDVADGRFRHAAFRVQLILRHLLFVQQFGQPLTDRLIELHSITIPVAVLIL